MINILNRFKKLNKALNIVSVCLKFVIKPHGAEKIAFAFAAAFAKHAQIFINAAVIFRDGHIIVVHKNNHIAALLARKIKALKRFAAAERTVADNGNDVFLAAAKIPALCKTARKAYGGGGVADIKHIMLALKRICISRYIIIFCRIQISVLSAGEHFMRIALVRNIKHDFILG